MEKDLDFQRITHIVFDFDGTLGDSYGPVTEGFNKVMERFGRDPLTAADVRPWVGIGLETAVTELLGADKVDESLRVFREHYATVYRDGTRLMPGVSEMLRGLDGRFRMGLCSNKPGDLLRDLVGHLGIGDRFKVVLGAYDVPQLKPHPAMLRKALDELDADGTDTLYVGDTLTDVEFARGCSVPFVLTLGGSGVREELEAQQPVALLERIADLRLLLGGAGRCPKK